jgi:hypothetical protein
LLFVWQVLDIGFTVFVNHWRIKMRSLIISILLVCFSCNVCLASSCDWSTIKTLPDGGYEYSPALNLCVGNLVQQNGVLTQQVSDLGKAITLKDLALTQSDQRAQLWSDTSGKLEDRLSKVDSLEKSNNILYFGLGVLLTFGAAYAAGQLIHR